ncbi:MAG: 1,4-dihydroxy-6-naphthoate synthase [Chitinophagaceae bacterium]|nr:1,4-dihydroxy-6-naphthoate synthase [Chitinophagaceae bacterium]
MKLTLGFSPCPNDTFIFDALVNNKIDTGGISIEPVLEDVETLNQWALQGKLDITKISYGVLPLVLLDYTVLNAGSALGKGVGPLLIAAHHTSKGKSSDNEFIPSLQPDTVVAIPGQHTTAHLLFTLAYPEARNKIFLRYNDIENFVLESPPPTPEGEAHSRLGVIIHENRFTYQQKGLIKVLDLGEFWENQTGLPIPLGGIVMRRELQKNLQEKVDRLIRKSLEYAFNNYPLLPDYVKQHAQEMDEDVMRQHIDLYVNNYSLNLGKEGRAAIWKLLEVHMMMRPEPANAAVEVFL